MHVSDAPQSAFGVKSTVRNRYYYGKLLDVFHFELEQDYVNEKRRLINRFILGYGVVCGLDVELTADCRSVFVHPGFAIDRCGREILVPCATHTVALPIRERQPEPRHEEGKATNERPHNHCDDDACVHVVLCYHECASDPAPTCADPCDEPDPCVPSLVRERYRIEVRDGRAPEPDDCSIPDLLAGGRINRQALAMRVTRPCPPLPRDCCIPLANIRLPEERDCSPHDVDISVRPVVYTNDLLFELFCAIASDPPGSPRGGKY